MVSPIGSKMRDGSLTNHSHPYTIQQGSYEDQQNGEDGQMWQNQHSSKHTCCHQHIEGQRGGRLCHEGRLESLSDSLVDFHDGGPSTFPGAWSHQTILSRHAWAKETSECKDRILYQELTWRKQRILWSICNRVSVHKVQGSHKLLVSCLLVCDW